MTVKVLNHPLINVLMTNLRSQETDSFEFRYTAKKISSLMSFEIFKDLKVKRKKIDTPLESFLGVENQDPKPFFEDLMNLSTCIYFPRRMPSMSVRPTLTYFVLEEPKNFFTSSADFNFLIFMFTS